MEGKEKRERERASGAAKKRRFLLLNYSRGLLLVCYYVAVGPTLLLLSMFSRWKSLSTEKLQACRETGGRGEGQGNWPIWNCCARSFSKCCERGKDDRMYISYVCILGWNSRGGWKWSLHLTAPSSSPLFVQTNDGDASRLRFRRYSTILLRARDAQRWILSFALRASLYP